MKSLKIMIALFICILLFNLEEISVKASGQTIESVSTIQFQTNAEQNNQLNPKPPNGIISDQEMTEGEDKEREDLPHSNQLSNYWWVMMGVNLLIFRAVIKQFDTDQRLTQSLGSTKS